MKNKVNIGTASIILIFIILCLSIFALLSLSDAKSAQVFAQRRADSVSAYYKNDALGQSFVKAASEAIHNGRPLSEAAQDGQALLPKDASVSIGNTGHLVCEIPMSAGQSLHIELQEEDGFVSSYYVYNSEDYAIDTRLPVWTGE